MEPLVASDVLRAVARFLALLGGFYALGVVVGTMPDIGDDPQWSVRVYLAATYPAVVAVSWLAAWRLAEAAEKVAGPKRRRITAGSILSEYFFLIHLAVLDRLALRLVF
jgi:hypothetical protein